MSDALVSPPVFAVTGALSLALLGVAIRRVKRAGDDCTQPDGHGERLVALMGVMGAFVFAAQMINFAIPGTGSSGHLVGGILLAALLGPWAALLTLSSVLVIQCLVFADGGFMALGANILNMAVLSCLVAYPLVFRPLMRPDASAGRILAASLLASVTGLELGALAVTLETEASGITALPDRTVPALHAADPPVHRHRRGAGHRRRALHGAQVPARAALRPASGACARRAAVGEDARGVRPCGAARRRIVLVDRFVRIPTVWSGRSNGRRGGPNSSLRPTGLHRTAAAVQQRTAVLPDYDTSFAGIVGSGAILIVVFGASRLFRAGQRRG